MSIATEQGKQEADEGYELLPKKDVSSQNVDGKPLSVPTRQLSAIFSDIYEVTHTYAADRQCPRISRL